MYAIHVLLQKVCKIVNCSSLDTWLFYENSGHMAPNGMSTPRDLSSQRGSNEKFDRTAVRSWVPVCNHVDCYVMSMKNKTKTPKLLRSVSSQFMFSPSSCGNNQTFDRVWHWEILSRPVWQHKSFSVVSQNVSFWKFFLSSVTTLIPFHCFTWCEDVMNSFGPDVATVTLFCCFIECEHSHITRYNCHSSNCMEVTKDSWLYTLRGDNISVTFPAIMEKGKTLSFSFQALADTLIFFSYCNFLSSCDWHKHLL